MKNGNWPELDWFLGNLVFWGKIQRRGTHVSPLKIGSRGDAFVFGGILSFYADLRRKFIWGNLGLGFLEGLGGKPRGGSEEGGTLSVFWVEVLVSIQDRGFNCVLLGNGVTDWALRCARARGFN
jgi:hypothetical protein